MGFDRIRVIGIVLDREVDQPQQFIVSSDPIVTKLGLMILLNREISLVGLTADRSTSVGRPRMGVREILRMSKNRIRP